MKRCKLFRYGAHLYIAEDHTRSKCKIGRSSRVAWRMHEMDAILLVVHECCGHLETRMKKHWDEYSIGGEWFRKEGRLLRWVKDRCPLSILSLTQKQLDSLETRKSFFNRHVHLFDIKETVNQSQSLDTLPFIDLASFNGFRVSDLVAMKLRGVSYSDIARSASTSPASVKYMIDKILNGCDTNAAFTNQ